ncbi:hypothetical protein [Devosia yakushimensis]|uniref:hypothetical protein n=1 Tax=Devosia yakushimensis TaxID=470028 RepID=UPI0024E0C9A2|nr:hypothetical protein [Devosia yakushimensis]
MTRSKIQRMERVGQIRRPKGTASRTAYGRRVTSKTFAILGASTPENRISTKGASRKQKGIVAPKNFKTFGRLCVQYAQRFVAPLRSYPLRRQALSAWQSIRHADLDRANETTT